MSTKVNTKFKPYQFLLVFILALVLFTIVLDFMVVSALSAILLPKLEITTNQFGILASAYPISAGISAFLISGYADKFDRKKLLLFFYSGFLFGVLFCANASSYELLVVARVLTGLFGGLVGSISFALITDLFETDQRGRAMGFLQMASSGSLILGLPLALYLATEVHWHLAFWLISIIGILANFLVFWKIKPVNMHLKKEEVKVNPLRHSLKIISNKNYLVVFLNNTLLVSADIILMTFSSAFCTNNLGVSLDDLPLLYGFAGVATFICSPIVGRLTDKYGQFNVFAYGSTAAIIVVALFTNLGASPLWIIVTIHTFIFLGINARSISSSAIGTMIPKVEDRGAFMAVDASIQQAVGGMAAAIAGFIVFQSDDGMINNFPNLGWIVMTIMVITIGFMYVIDRSIKRKNVPSD